MRLLHQPLVRLSAIAALSLASLLVWWMSHQAAAPQAQGVEASTADPSTVTAQASVDNTHGGTGIPVQSLASPWVQDALNPTAAPPSRVPAILELSALQASLAALQQNGADLRTPMRSRHQVQAVDQRTVDELMRWGRKQGFTLSTDRFDMHGGVQAQLINFDRLMVPDAQAIQLDGLAILQALLGMDTAEYVTWSGDINRR